MKVTFRIENPDTETLDFSNFEAHEDGAIIHQEVPAFWPVPREGEHFCFINQEDTVIDAYKVIEINYVYDEEFNFKGIVVVLE